MSDPRHVRSILEVLLAEKVSFVLVGALAGAGS
jgi:hypothetical protein